MYATERQIDGTFNVERFHVEDSCGTVRRGTSNPRIKNAPRRSNPQQIQLGDQENNIPGIRNYTSKGA